MFSLLQAFELQAVFVGGGGAAEAEALHDGGGAGKFPVDGSCMLFVEEGLGFAQALAQLMMSGVCADLLAANVPENVRLLRSYLAVEQGRVHLNDWLGQKILNPKA